MSDNLLDAFNALARSPTIPPENVINEWHFDLRFIRRQPTSSLCLIILQPHGNFMHIASLPLIGDASLDESVAGLEYFPDTPQEAAPEIVKVLLHFFVDVLNLGGTSDPATLAPWQLTTIDKALADAVSAELKQQGVCPPRLCNVSVSSAEVNAVANAQLKISLEDTWTGDDILRTFDDDFLPQSASLLDSAPNSFIPRGYEDLEGPARYACMARHYGAMLARGTPPDGGPYHGPRSLVKEHMSLVDIQQLLMSILEDVVRSTADHGDSGAALDYGIRRNFLRPRP